MTDAVLDWLLAGDPAIRWQVMRDLLDAPEAQWRAERARVEHEGWGAALLACEDPEGTWAGGACFPGDFSRERYEQEGQPWTATMNVLSDLTAYGLDPSTDRAREIVRLLGERQPDGGWNCERENGSTRSSFHSTIDVLEGLLEWERQTGGTASSRAARAAGEKFLLQRHLVRRLSTGEVADPDFLRLGFPWRWYYNVLRGLDHLRRASELTGAAPDPRAAKAIEHLRSQRGSDGRWPLEWQPRGRVWFEMEPVGTPSRWVTLHALRILRWWDGWSDGRLDGPADSAG